MKQNEIGTNFVFLDIILKNDEVLFDICSAVTLVSITMSHPSGIVRIIRVPEEERPKLLTDEEMVCYLENI